MIDKTLLTRLIKEVTYGGAQTFGNAHSDADTIAERYIVEAEASAIERVWRETHRFDSEHPALGRCALPNRDRTGCYHTAGTVERVLAILRGDSDA